MILALNMEFIFTSEIGFLIFSNHEISSMFPQCSWQWFLSLGAAYKIWNYIHDMCMQYIDKKNHVTSRIF